jgi:Zn-dependent protease with chaperone function
MSMWAWGPILVALVVAWAGPRVLRSIHPRTAVRLGTAAALVVALSTGMVLAIPADLTLKQLQAMFADGMTGPWRASLGSLVLGFGAAAVVSLLLASATQRLVRTVRSFYLAWRDTRRINPAGERVVVVQDAEPTAFAVTGYPGRVVVSTAMLEALDPNERAVLLAHEDAHLRHHHQIYVQFSKLAAAANPLLRPIAGLVSAATERWADEDAAAAVGDRELAARAVARAALATHHHRPRLSPAVSAVQGVASESELATRINRLMAPPPSPARRVVAAVLIALSVCAATGGMATIVGHQQVERIETTALAGR